MTGPLGYIPDAQDARDWRFAESKILSAAPLTGADSYDYRAYDIEKVQLAGSCVGHSVAAAAYLAMAIARMPIAFPSALLPYTGARLIGDPPKQPGEPKLTDWGCGPRFAMLFSREHGLVAEARWPETPANINAVPPLDVWQEGECAQLIAFERIPDGDGAADAMKAAGRRGHCPWFGMIVDEKFDQIGREVYASPGGKQRGGHAMVVVGYSAILDAFLVRNTWGRNFADGGYVWIAASFMNRHTFDKWVVTAAPEVR